MNEDSEYYFLGKETAETLIEMNKEPNNELLQKRGAEIFKELTEEVKQRINDLK